MKILRLDFYPANPTQLIGIDHQEYFDVEGTREAQILQFVDARRATDGRVEFIVFDCNDFPKLPVSRHDITEVDSGSTIGKFTHGVQRDSNLVGLFGSNADANEYVKWLEEHDEKK